MEITSLIASFDWKSLLGIGVIGLGSIIIIAIILMVVAEVISKVMKIASMVLMFVIPFLTVIWIFTNKDILIARLCEIIGICL